MNESTEKVPRERVPRESRTPRTEALFALNIAWEFFAERSEAIMADNPEQDFGELSNHETFFTEEIFGAAWNNPDIDGDKVVDKAMLLCDGKHGSDSGEDIPSSLLIMLAIVAYAVQAMKAEEGGKHDEAWTFASDARYWAATLGTVWAVEKNNSNPAVELAKKRHAENYALKEYARAHWRENIDPNLSAQKAADILIKTVPLSHKKLAEIVAAERKKQP